MSENEDYNTIYNTNDNLSENIVENTVKNCDENSTKNTDENPIKTDETLIKSDENLAISTEEAPDQNNDEKPALKTEENTTKTPDEKPAKTKVKKRKKKKSADIKPPKFIDSYKPNKISKKGNNGNSLSAQTRAVVFNVLQFAFREKKAKTSIMDINKAMDRVAAMTGVCVNTLSSINKEGSANDGVWETKVRKKRRKVVTNLNDEDKINIINKIGEFTKRNEHITLKKLHSELKQESKFSGGRTSLQIVLNSLGYKWEKTESNKKVLQKVPIPEPSNTTKSPKKSTVKNKKESMESVSTNDFSQVYNMVESPLKHNMQLQKFMDYQQPLPMQGPSHMQVAPHQMPQHSQQTSGPYNIQQRLGLHTSDYIFNHL